MMYAIGSLCVLWTAVEFFLLWRKSQRIPRAWDSNGKPLRVSILP